MSSTVINNVMFCDLLPPDPEMVIEFYASICDAVALYEDLLAIDHDQALEQIHLYINSSLSIISNEYPQAERIKYVITYDTDSDTCTLHPIDDDPFTTKVCIMVMDIIFKFIP